MDDSCSSDVTPYAASTSSPHRMISPARSAPIASASDPSGQASSASIVGPTRIADGPRPGSATLVPRPHRHRRRGQHRSHRPRHSDRVLGVERIRGHHRDARAASRRPGRRPLRRSASGSRSAPSGRAAARPSASSSRRAPRRSIRGAEKRCFANRTERSPQSDTTRIDQPARDQRRSGGVVADCRDHAVVLVAEVGVQSHAVAESPELGCDCVRSTDGSAGTPDRSVTTCDQLPSLRPLALGPNSNATAHVTTSASKSRLTGPRRPDHRRSMRRSGVGRRLRRVPRGSTVERRRRVVRRSGRRAPTPSARNSAAASAYGPPPRRLDPPRLVAAAICDRYGGLPITRSKLPSGRTESIQPPPSASAHTVSIPRVESSSRSWQASTSTPTQSHRTTPNARPPQRTVVEEPTVTACRVEHLDRSVTSTCDEVVVDDCVDNRIDEVLRR